MNCQSAMKSDIGVPKRSTKEGQIEVRDRLISVLRYVSQHTRNHPFCIKQRVSPKDKTLATSGHLTMSVNTFGFHKWRRNASYHRLAVEVSDTAHNKEFSCLKYQQC